VENNKTLYEILGFSKNGYTDSGEKVSFESIVRARNRLIYGDGIEGSVPFWMHDDINKAYTILSNPTTRKEYDDSLLMQDVSYSAEESIGLEEPSLETEVEEPIVETNEEEYDEAVVDLDDYSLNNDTNEENLREEVESQIEEPQQKVELPQSKPVQEIIPITEKEKKEEKTKKEMSRAKKRILFGLATTFLGIPGMVFAYHKLYKTKDKKLKLHFNRNRKISEIKTEESKLIEQYNNNINKEINEFLARPNNNYNLQIAKARYKNQVELLKKRIELKLSEKVNGKGLLKYKLEYVALNNQLDRAKKRLENIEEKIEMYDSTKKTRNFLSNTLNEKLYQKAEEIKKLEKNGESFGIKKLNVRKERLQKARDFSVKRLKLTRKTLGSVRDFGARTWDNVRSIKEIFTSYDNICGYTGEPENQRVR